MEKGKSIKMMRSDGGAEYKSNDFKSYCEEFGLQLTFPYTPQPTVVIEIKNKTMTEMARRMLKARGVPNYFWVEVVCTVYHL